MAYKRVVARDIIFLFKYDDAYPELLHIYVRYQAQIADALNAFYDPDARSIWNQERQHWETQSDTHMLYWMWLEEGKKVLVISCFSL